jgi:asparagine N-glycosylation enzyme membrane subunit Stt3
MSNRLSGLYIAMLIAALVFLAGKWKNTDVFGLLALTLLGALLPSLALVIGGLVALGILMMNSASIGARFTHVLKGGK